MLVRFFFFSREKFWDENFSLKAEKNFKPRDAFLTFIFFVSKMKLFSVFLLFSIGGECISDSEKKSNANALYSEYWYNSTNKTNNVLYQNFKYVLENKDEPTEEDLKEDKITESRRNLLSKRLQSLLPPFAVSERNSRNQQCVKESKLFLQELNNLKLWALKMHDSSGKIPSGLLDGNVNQFGDFDQCLNVHDPVSSIRGKYCLAYLQITPKEDEFEPDVYRDIYDLMHSHFAFRSKLSDPGHRVPRYSSSNWGLCVPDSCLAEDVENELKMVADQYSNGTGFDVEVRVDSEMCQVEKPFRISTSFFIVGCLFLFVMVISLAATVKDFLSEKKENEGISISSFINCFSLKRNVEQLFSLKRAGDDIESVHGIRMINAIMLVISHKSMALFFIPYTNRTYMAENLGQTWSVIARAASLYTDPFIMISGILTSYSFIRTLRKNRKLDLKKEYINRLFRIIPPLAAVILFCTFILPELASGPLWNLTVTHHATMCKNYWWRNFLFIHNYFGFENMCLTHTHHVGIDTQLFFISPILILILYKWPIPGLSALVSLAAISTAARYQVTISRNLSYFVYPGASIAQMFATANYSYIIPFHRLTVYIIGIILGYLLQYCGKEYKIKPNHQKLGWMVAFTLVYFSFVKTTSMSRSGYVYNNLDAGLYAALAPIGWCLFFAWIIFITHVGSGGILGRVLSSKYWLIWTRLSYAVYLTQFPIYFFNVGVQRAAQPYSIFLMASILEYAAIGVASVALTLFIDFPFNNVKKLFLQR